MAIGVQAELERLGFIAFLCGIILCIMGYSIFAICWLSTVIKKHQSSNAHFLTMSIIPIRPDRINGAPIPIHPIPVTILLF